MWGLSLFPKRLWAGTLWGPLAGIVPPVPPIAITGGHYGEKKKRKSVNLWQNEKPRPALSMREQLQAIADRQDEEDIFRLLIDL